MMSTLPWLGSSGLPWARSGGLPWGGLPWAPTASPAPQASSSRYGPSMLDPEQLFALQKRLAEAKLTQKPQARGGSGLLGGLAGGPIGQALDVITPDIVGTALSQIGESLLYTPAGIIHLGQSAVRDFGDLATKGDISPERLGGIAMGMKNQIVEDFRHPLRNPGYLAMDLFGLASMGATGYARGATALGKVGAERAARAASAAPPIARGAPLPGPSSAARAAADLNRTEQATRNAAAASAPPPIGPTPLRTPWVAPNNAAPTILDPRAFVNPAPETPLPRPGFAQASPSPVTTPFRERYAQPPRGPDVDATIPPVGEAYAPMDVERIMQAPGQQAALANRANSQARAIQQRLDQRSTKQVPISNPRFQTALQTVHEAGWTATVDEGGRIRLVHPQEPVKGGPVLDVIDEALRTDQLAKQQIGEARSKLFAEKAKTGNLNEEALSPLTRFMGGGLEEKLPPISSAGPRGADTVTPVVEGGMESAPAMGLQDMAEKLLASEHAPSGEAAGLDAIAALLEQQRLMEQGGLRINRTHGAEEMRVQKIRTKLAQDAGFDNPEAAATAMARVGATPLMPKERAAFAKLRNEADRIARDRSRVSVASQRGSAYRVYTDEWGQTKREVVGQQDFSSGGKILVDGKESGVSFRRANDDPSAPWYVVADDRPTPYVASTMADAARLAKMDAVEKVVQEGTPGYRSLDQPEIPEFRIGGQGVSIHDAVDKGLKLDKERKRVERETRFIAAQKQIEDLQAQVPSAELELPPAAIQAMKEDAPVEVHDLLDELGAQEKLVDDLDEGPSDADLRDIDEPISDDEMAKLLEDDDVAYKDDAPDDDWLREMEEEQERMAPEPSAPEPSPAATTGAKPELVGQTDKHDFWDIGGEVHRAPRGSGLDVNGMPMGLRWESKRSHWDAYKDSYGTVAQQAHDGLHKPDVKPQEGTKVEPSGQVSIDTPSERPPTPGGQMYEAAEKELAAEAAKDTSKVTPRKAGLNARAMKTSQNQLREALGIDEDAAKAISRDLTPAMKGLYENFDGNPPIREVQSLYQRVLGLDEAAAADLYGKLHLGAASKTGELRLNPGPLHKHIEKVMKLDPEQSAELAARVKGPLSAELQAAKAEGRAPKHSVLLKVLQDATDKATGEKLFHQLYKISGGSSDSMFRIFVREFFKPSKRETFLLMRPGTETVTDPAKRVRMGRRWVKQEARKREVPTIRQATAQLSVNPIRAGFQKFLYEYGINRAPEWKKGESRLSNAHARFAEMKFKFHEGDRQRLADYLAVSEGTKGAIQEGEDVAKMSKSPGFGAYVDSANQLATIATLYAKPGYIPPNILGQILFNTIDVAWNPIALARSYKFSHDVRKGKLGKEATDRLHLVTGQGMYGSIRPQRGASRRLDQASGKIADMLSTFMDSPFREASFYNAAYRAGFRSTDDMKQLLLAKDGSPLFEDLLDVAQNANRDIVDYGRLSKVEKTAIRRAVFFYPWIKGSTMYTARFMSEHPFQATAAIGAARQGQDRAEEMIGEVPSYLRGLVPIGGGRDVPGMGHLPTVLNPSSLSIFGSAGQAANAVRGTLFGDVRSGEQLSEYFTPALSAGIAAATRVNPFTGERYEQGVSPLNIAAQEMMQTVAPLRAMKKIGQARQIEAGTKDPSALLFPSSVRQEAMQYLTGMAPRTYNLAEGQERAAAESTSLLSAEKQQQVKWNERVRVAAEEAKRIGLKIDKSVSDAFKAKAERATEYGLTAEALGKKERELNQIDRLQADMQLLVRKGIFKEDQARALLQQYAGLEDNAISNFRTKLHRAYMGQAVLTAFKSRMLAAGADPKLIEVDL